MTEPEAISYDSVHAVLMQRLPELREPHAKLIVEWGREAPGQYIVTEDILGSFIWFLLVRDPSSSRDALLLRSFAFVELLLDSGDSKTKELGFIGLLESHAHWWYARARAFLGPQAVDTLDRYQPHWREEAALRSVPPPGARAERLRSDYLGIDPLVERLISAA